MYINFANTKIKQSPNGNQGMSVSLAENDNTIVPPMEQKSANIDTTKLTEAETKVVNDFIALCKSKIK